MCRLQGSAYLGFVPASAGHALVLHFIISIRSERDKESKHTTKAYDAQNPTLQE